ncbi:hypothetical protein LTR36_002457 [Oleoguttula mirabilis]|uniref:Acyltransferase MbtK/IucB-like conserved domain-containing protein n=1 Tax=Oleoguttula mirabilis TaxID=1507867 RepID=A0AAV9JKR5_9PEZI|nr:hypothetical protein LTR36_002457 [Oleoguttula mirabilis]
MAPSIVHLPNGQTLTVTPVFGGIQFKSNDLSTHHNVFPPGWTIILHSEDEEDEHVPKPSTAAHTHPDLDATPRPAEQQTIRHHVHRYRRPTLRNDHLFFSSISNPSSTDFRPASSPTRQIAMMLWATLWWYFHQPTPSPYLTTPASAQTPEEGRPKGEWRVNINREGIFKGKHTLPKLERMGLIASEDSTVGIDPDDGVRSTGEGWSKMFISQRSFWQLDARIYLFTLPPAQATSPYPSVSPAVSRAASPNRNSAILDTAPGAMSHALNRTSTPPGPFTSGSHLPTFYPPPPLQYTFTNGIRHPIRPKPPRQGETIYTRYVPSLGQWLSFRVASLSPRPVPHRGPTSVSEPTAPFGPSTRDSLRAGTPSSSDCSILTVKGLSLQQQQDHGQQQQQSSEPPAPDTLTLTDAELLHKWMNDPRVAHSWGEAGPLAHQEHFLRHALTRPHSFPVIGCFDGQPFGFFEIYWVPEDRLAAHMAGGAGAGGEGDWCRGLHVLVGEQAFRGPQRVKVWLSALVHYCWLADSRTGVVVMEPRVDNEKLRRYCEGVGFYREREVAFAHKQSNLMKIRREAWERPEL